MTPIRSVLYYLCVFQLVFHSRHAFLLWHTYLLCACHYWSFILLACQDSQGKGKFYHYNLPKQGFGILQLQLCIYWTLLYLLLHLHMGIIYFILSPSHPQMIQLWDGKNRCSISIATSVYIHCLFEKRHSKSLENSKDIQNYRFSHVKNCSRFFPSCLLLFALSWKWRMFKNQHTAKNKPTELIWIDLCPHLYWLNFHQSYIFKYSRIYKFWK